MGKINTTGYCSQQNSQRYMVLYNAYFMRDRKKQARKGVKQ